MASGASARTLLLLLVGVLTLAAVALPAGADEPGPDCAGLTPTVFGTTAGEWLVGTEGDDVIRAGAGDDTVSGLGGNDVICAGPGNDTTRAGPGNDRVRSGRGDDSSSGESGDDEMRGQGDNDLADGGVGVDMCLFETHERCEADLDVNLTGPSSATKGGTGVFVYNAHLTNHGPTPAVNSRVEVTLPAGATFVPGSSDSRCTAESASVIRCTFGSMGLELPDDADFGVNFTGCTDPGTVNLVAEAQDPRTIDHVDPNTTDTLPVALTIDPTCATAADDSVSVPHDSGANVVDVLANDTNATSVASATNGAHGTVAVANGGANVTYTPDALYCGPDSFTYTVNPGGAQATVTVNVLCPTAVDDAYTGTPCWSGTPPPPLLAPVDMNNIQYRLPVLSNDLNPAGGGPFFVGSITQPTVNGSPQGSATIIESGGAILLQTEGDDFQDTYVLTYQLTPGGSQATAALTVECIEGST
jgi:uncharacterized repeat protein (TIGR01451 family)